MEVIGAPDTPQWVTGTWSNNNGIDETCFTIIEFLGEDQPSVDELAIFYLDELLVMFYDGLNVVHEQTS